MLQANREAPTLRFTAARHEVASAAASSASLVDGFAPDAADPEGLEAQVAALLGAAGGAGAAAMAEAEEALAEKVGELAAAAAAAAWVHAEACKRGVRYQRVLATVQNSFADL
jgi:uncharacterized protein YqeY